METRTCIAVCGGLSLVFAAIAGNINPPAGPIGPTGKALTEVEPRIAVNATNTPGDANSVFKITQSGSYYPTGNVACAGKVGVIINCPNATLDLNGFVISDGFYGVRADGSTSVGNIFGGVVENCQYGCFIGSGSVHDLIVRGCTAAGVFATRGRVSNCVVSECGVGITTAGTEVADCVSSGNSLYGFSSGQFDVTTYRNCQANHNTSHGFFGGQFGGGGRPTINVIGCTAVSNGGDGFHVDVGRIENSFSHRNTGVGVFAVTSCAIVGSTVSDNSSAGIDIVSGRVERCVVNHNGSQGIRVTDHGTILANTINDNEQSSAGIWLRGGGNRVEDNQCNVNGFGIWTVAADNFIAKNTCRSNALGNFSVGAGNEMAPVVTNPGSNGFSTMTAWSNVAY